PDPRRPGSRRLVPHRTIEARAFGSCGAGEKLPSRSPPPSRLRPQLFLYFDVSGRTFCVSREAFRKLETIETAESAEKFGVSHLTVPQGDSQVTDPTCPLGVLNKTHLGPLN